jgi:biopolymer transport protein ExbD
MGVKLGGGEDDVIADINITPFVDIVLVILIIFMVTTTAIVKASIKVDLPDAANAESPENETIGISLQADGAILVNGSSVSPKGLREGLRAARAANEDVIALVAADKGVAWGRVVWLLDTMKDEGQAKYAFNIDKTAMVGPDPASIGEGTVTVPDAP